MQLELADLDFNLEFLCSGCKRLYQLSQVQCKMQLIRREPIDKEKR